MKLILFDIDGTIMDSGGAGTRSMDIAFKELFSVDNAFRDISMAGKTDVEILKEGLKRHNLPSDNGVIPAFISAYVKNLARDIDNPKKVIKPGIAELLGMLSERDGIRLCLLTGNLEEGARIKLKSIGVDRYFPFGAFGSDHEDRNMLLPIAADKFKGLYKEGISFKDCIIIGDTPKDVECARPYGAKAIAVATGPYSMDILNNTGADMVLKDLSNPNEFLRFIGA